MFDDKKIESFTQREATIKDVAFRFDKMGAMEGFRIFERIRKELASTLSGLESDKGEKLGTEFIKSILSLEPTFIDLLRVDLFKHVKFKGNGAQNFIDLKGAEDMAFQGLSPASVYEVFLRSLAVNFIDTLNELKSKVGSLD